VDPAEHRRQRDRTIARQAVADWERERRLIRWTSR